MNETPMNETPMNETPNAIAIDWAQVLKIVEDNRPATVDLRHGPIEVIKAIRNIYQTTLKGAKALFDGAEAAGIITRFDDGSQYGTVVLGPNAGVLPIVNPISTVNVIEINVDGAVASLAAYPDNPAGVKMAEERYLALITENLTPDEHRDFDGVARDGALDEGTYEIGDWKILLVHSTLGSKE